MEQFITYEGKQYSANQAYQYARDKGYTKSFSDFLKEYGNSDGKGKLQSIFEKAKSGADTLQDFLKKNNIGINDWNVKDPTIPNQADDSQTRYFGLKKPYAIGLGIVLTGLIIWGGVAAYKQLNK